MFRPCILIPTYNNAHTIGDVVDAARAHLGDVLVIDDGSDGEARATLGLLAREGRATVRRRPTNGGKGAAVVDGLRLAQELRFTHALQIDGDGQHDLDDIPRFLAAARARPAAMITGRPVFDATAPRSRRIGRLISQFWVSLETAGRVIHDPLCGFRVYPVEATLAARPRAMRMGHDPEVAVKLYWRGAPIINIDTRIKYLSADQGGVSHFHLFWDNLEMSWTHTRLCVQMGPRLAWRWLQWGR